MLKEPATAIPAPRLPFTAMITVAVTTGSSARVYAKDRVAETFLFI